MSILPNRLNQQRLAVILAAVFLQGLVGTVVHFQVTSHDFCERHQQFTHNQHDADSTDTGSSVTQRSDTQDEPASPQPHDRESVCHWLAWLHHSGVSTPALQHDIQLPAPAVAPAGGLELTAGRPVASVVPIRHVSPMNSPPRTPQVATATA